MYIQDEYKFCNINKLYRYEEGMGQRGQRYLTTTERVCRVE